MLVYDVTKRSSFDNIENWARQIRQRAGSAIATVLVANKVDAPGVSCAIHTHARTVTPCPSADIACDRGHCGATRHQAEVSEAEGAALAKRMGIGFVMTSAKENVNVDQAFKECAARAVRNIESGDGRGSLPDGMRIGGGAGGGGGGCAC